MVLANSCTCVELGVAHEVVATETPNYWGISKVMLIVIFQQLGLGMGPQSNMWPTLRVKFGYTNLTLDDFASVMSLVVTTGFIANSAGMVLGSFIIKGGRRRNLMIVAVMSMIGFLLMQLMTMNFYMLGNIIW